ncbi:MAG: hypothetical protein L0G99_08335, partial [Propionibacteriales bacterium]|nr:hypothetical protein [Propionibacteriales bacterium]
AVIQLVFVPLVFALVLAAFAGYHTWRRLPVSWLLLGGIAGLELMLIIQLIASAIALAGTERAVDGVVFIGYLIACVVVPSVATLWGLSDKSRWGTGVIVIGMITIAVLCLRVWSIWTSSPA